MKNKSEFKRIPVTRFVATAWPVAIRRQKLPRRRQGRILMLASFPQNARRVRIAEGPCAVMGKTDLAKPNAGIPCGIVSQRQIRSGRQP